MSKQVAIRDRFNSKKRWHVKRYTSGNYYMTQSIDGAKLYPFQRVTRSIIGEILNRDDTHVTRWFL